MKIRTQNVNAVTAVELQGELDGGFAELFRNTITGVTDAHKAGIVLDMSDVGFIDSEGLEQLLWARDYCNENNCQFRLAGLDGAVAKILELTRLENEFDRYAELGEAVKSFA